MKFKMNELVQRMSQFGYRCVMCIRGACSSCGRCDCCKKRPR